VFLTLVRLYEAKRRPIRIEARFDVLYYSIEELGHTQSELAELLGSRSRASELLSLRRALTVDLIHRIGDVENSGRPPRSSLQGIGVPHNLWVSVLTGIGDGMYPVVVIFESPLKEGGMEPIDSSYFRATSNVLGS